MLKSGPRSDKNCFRREKQLLWHACRDCDVTASKQSSTHRHTCAIQPLTFSRSARIGMIRDKTRLHKRPAAKSF